MDQCRGKGLLGPWAWCEPGGPQYGTQSYRWWHEPCHKTHPLVISWIALAPDDGCSVQRWSVCQGENGAGGTLLIAAIRSGLDGTWKFSGCVSVKWCEIMLYSASFMVLSQWPTQMISDVAWVINYYFLPRLDMQRDLLDQNFARGRLDILDSHNKPGYNFS